MSTKRIYFTAFIAVIVVSGFVLYKRTTITGPKDSQESSKDNNPNTLGSSKKNGLVEQKNVNAAPPPEIVDEKPAQKETKVETIYNNRPDPIIKTTRIDENSWKPPTLPEDLAHADQTDENLIKHIKDYWILPPFEGPRHLREPNRQHYSQGGQSAYIDKMLKQKRNGFFIECGAANGEVNSNSLFFEKHRDWTGLLIEANPKFFNDTLKTRRHAYMMNACLSPKAEPMVLDFRVADQIGGLVDFMEEGHKRRVINVKGKAAPIKVQCFPLLSALKALNVNHVDYFSLDIEGAEIYILQSFPFDQIKVDVLSVEVAVSGGGGATGKKIKQVQDIMIGKYGYEQTPFRSNEDIMFKKGV